MRRQNPGIGFVLASACLLLAVGCSPRFEPVDVDFSRVELEEMERGTIELTIHNPNPFRVDIESLHYSLSLTGDTLAKGSRRTPVRIAASDTTVAEFPFTIELDLSDLLARLPDIMDDTIELRLAGRYSLPAFLGPMKRPFRYRKEIPLLEPLGDIIRPFKQFFGSED